MPLSIAEVALDLEDVLSFVFDDISVCTRGRGVMTITFLAILVPKTFFVVLVFLASLALVDGRLLVLAIRYISRKSVRRLNLSEVFLLLFLRLVLSGTP